MDIPNEPVWPAQRAVLRRLAAANIGVIATALVCALAVTPVYAQGAAWPAKPLRMVIPFAPGSGADYTGRYYAERLGKVLGQPVLLDNRPGASGAIAMTAVKDAPADGYTIAMGTNSPVTVNAVTVKNLPYDPFTDFKPIVGMYRGNVAYVVRADSALRTIGDYVAAGKSAKFPGLGTYSIGYQLMAEWFANASGSRFLNVPYKGLAQMMTDLLGGQIDVAIGDFGGMIAMMRDGRVRVLGVAAEARIPDYPDVPTIREAGYADYITYTWGALYVRTQTPEPVTRTLIDAMLGIMATPETRAYIAKVGAEHMPLAPEAMTKFQRVEFERFRDVAQKAGIKPE